MRFSLKRVREGFGPTSPDESCLEFGKKTMLEKHSDYGSDDEKNLLHALQTKPWISYNIENISKDELEVDKINATHKATLPVGVIRGCSSCEGCQKVLARWRPEAGCRPVLEDAPVFFPLEEEFQDTVKYIASITAEAEPYGICRIVPPQSWRPPCPLKDKDKRRTAKFPTRVQRLDKLQVREAQTKKEQLRKRKRGRPRLNRDNSYVHPPDDDGKFGFEPGPLFTLETFESYAKQFRDEYFGLKDKAQLNDEVLKNEPSIECIEGEYWRIVEHATEQLEVLYGADIDTRKFGSGFPRINDGVKSDFYETSGWNLNNIARLGGSVLSFEEEEISGVLVPWLYVGMCLSSFCWHVEDHHFYSLNYMHFGAPKVWYGVPGNAALKLENAMKKYLPELFEEQPDLLHKLVTQLSPSVLRADGVPVYRAVQRPGEFIVTFPRAYHAGFNCGFNCAEAINIAPIDWLPAGQIAVEVYRQEKRKNTVSHDKLLLGAVRQYLLLTHKLSSLSSDVNLTKWKGLLTQQRVLSTVFKERVELERSSRHKVEQLVYIRKMDKNFDSTEAKECIVCHFDLHLSAIGCKCTQGRYACLEHLRDLCMCGKSKKYALYRYEISELDEVAAVLEGTGDLGKGCQSLLGCSSVSVMSKDDYIQESVDHQSGSSSSVTNIVSKSTIVHPVDFCESTPLSGKIKETSACLLLDLENFELIHKSKIVESPSLAVEMEIVEPSHIVPSVHLDSREGNNNVHHPCKIVQGKDKTKEVILLSDDEDIPDNQSMSNVSFKTNASVSKTDSLDLALADAIVAIKNNTNVVSTNVSCATANSSNASEGFDLLLLPSTQIVKQFSLHSPSSYNVADTVANKCDTYEEHNSSQESLLTPQKQPHEGFSKIFNSHSTSQVQSDRTIESSSNAGGMIELSSHEIKPVSILPSSCTSLKNGSGIASSKDWLCLGNLQTASIDQKSHDNPATELLLNYPRFEEEVLGHQIFPFASLDSQVSSLQDHLPYPKQHGVQVDLLSTGRLVVGMAWCNKDAIFPAGDLKYPAICFDFLW
ncbi:hypothetical protein KP509_09G000100 [Ceratopteris richardii]|uniref:Uncharacterized protein n=1 Tax=Ceratopteris richardii TaxID=49495 RepID=A0A8T2U3T2_CERRI|nr:hypothetical protein KP509_09G000100 [Ceratopteris richardii]